MAEWSNFVSRLGAEDWMIYTDIENIKDKKVYAEAHRRGVRVSSSVASPMPTETGLERCMRSSSIP